jgi:hypothetical protein
MLHEFGRGKGSTVLGGKPQEKKPLGDLGAEVLMISM